MPDYEPNLVLSTEEFKVVGSRPIRHDGPDKVMGRARYAADIHLPGMLHGKMLRSPYAHAAILDIDTSEAEAISGVMAIATHADLPPARSGLIDMAGAFVDAQGAHQLRRRTGCTLVERRHQAVLLHVRR